MTQIWEQRSIYSIFWRSRVTTSASNHTGLFIEQSERNATTSPQYRGNVYIQAYFTIVSGKLCVLGNEFNILYIYI